MPTFAEIEQKISDDIGTINKHLHYSVLHELPNIISNDENIYKLALGHNDNGQGILVSTDKRLLFISKKLFKINIEYFTYNKITSIQSEMGMIMGKIMIYTAGNSMQIDKIKKDITQEILEYARRRIEIGKENATLPATPVDTVTQLEKLAKLKEHGMLTEEEFTSQKKKILKG